VIAETGEVVHSRLREGKASSGRGASSFARQALARLKRLGLLDEIVVRADSGFYAEKVVAACQAHGARFSISIRLQKGHHERIAAIPEEAWTPIPYWLEGAADVAEIPYQPFGKKRTYRMIVRRVAPTPGSQLWLKGVAYSHYAFLTDREGEMLELEADHRQHAVVENVIRDSKYGLGLNHMPSGKFGANAAWLKIKVSPVQIWASAPTAPSNSEQRLTMQPPPGLQQIFTSQSSAPMQRCRTRRLCTGWSRTTWPIAGPAAWRRRASMPMAIRSSTSCSPGANGRGSRRPRASTPGR